MRRQSNLMIVVHIVMGSSKTSPLHTQYITEQRSRKHCKDIFLFCVKTAKQKKDKHKQPLFHEL